jgi:hypothetical protein
LFPAAPSKDRQPTEKICFIISNRVMAQALLNISGHFRKGKGRFGMRGVHDQATQTLQEKVAELTDRFLRGKQPDFLKQHSARWTTISSRPSKRA